MDTRSRLPGSGTVGPKPCVYCGKPAPTKDHAPPRCFLRPPLPSNLITVPACKGCNTRFSFSENVVKTLLALVCIPTELADERDTAHRAMERDNRLRSVIEGARRTDGNFELRGELVDHVNRV